MQQEQIIQILKNNLGLIENRDNLEKVHKWKSLDLPEMLPIDIQEKKQFYKTQKGWQWFKNLVIPTIRVFETNKTETINKNSKIEESVLSSSLPELQQAPIEQQQQQSMFDQKSSSQIVAKLECFKNISSNNFEIVEVHGVKEKTMTEQQLFFKSLKFEETSFMTRSNYFVIVVSIYEKNEVTKSEILKNLFVSPLLLVDARKKYWSERQAQVEIFDPFLPNLADKVYEKVQKKDRSRQTVGVDLKGIENYFTSYSIRHKIRNPFFLLFKFYNGIKLYFNTEYITPQDNYDHLLVQIHKHIFKLFMTDQEFETPKNKKLLLLSLNVKDDDISNKEPVSKISKYLNSLEGPVLSFSPYSHSNIAPNFQELKYSDKLKESYKRVYNKLLTLKFKIKDEVSNVDSMNTFTHLPNHDSSDNSSQNSQNNNLFHQTVIQTTNKLGTIIDLCIRTPQLKQQCERIQVSSSSGNKQNNNNSNSIKKHHANNNNNQHEPQVKKMIKPNTDFPINNRLNNNNFPQTSSLSYIQPQNLNNLIDEGTTRYNTFSNLNLSKLQISSLSDINEHGQPQQQMQNFGFYNPIQQQQLIQQQQQNQLMEQMGFEHQQELHMYQLQQEYLKQQYANQQQQMQMSTQTKSQSNSAIQQDSFRQLPTEIKLEQSSMPNLYQQQIYSQTMQQQMQQQQQQRQQSISQMQYQQPINNNLLFQQQQQSKKQSIDLPQQKSKADMNQIPSLGHIPSMTEL